MSAAPIPTGPSPRWATGTLWAILAAFLVVGTLGLGAVAYGATGLLSGGALVPNAVWVLGGLAVGLLAFLFTAGILYRVDRYRGKTGRRVELFE